MAFNWMKREFKSNSYPEIKITFDGKNTLFLCVEEKEFPLLNTEVRQMAILFQKHLDDVLMPLPATASLQDVINNSSPTEIGDAFTRFPKWVVQENVGEIVEQTWGAKIRKVIDAVLNI